MERSHLEAQARRVLEHIEILNHHYAALLEAERPDIRGVLESAEAALRQLLNGTVASMEPSNGTSRVTSTGRRSPAHAKR
jgi:hypothetical protein